TGSLLHEPHRREQWPIRQFPSNRDNLAWVHDVGRVERTLEGAHQRDGSRAVLGLEIFHLFLPHPVLAGTGPSHGERALDQTLDEGFAAGNFLRILRIDERLNVKVAVPDMADDRCD